MKNAVIVYGSTTGNTQKAAGWVRDALIEAGSKADVYSVSEVKRDSLSAYDLIILGASTWGQGEIQDDFIPFYEEMTAEVFSGKDVAVFGCGDSQMFPDYFCQAVDLIAGKAKECNAKIGSNPLKIDGDIRAYRSEISYWAKGLV